MKLSSVIIIALVGIFLVGITNTQIVQDEFTAVLATDRAPTNLHTSCLPNVIYLRACLAWTDPFEVLIPNGISERRPYSRYTIICTSTLGGATTFPNLIEHLLILNTSNTVNLIGPGATLTCTVAGQQINDTTKLSLFSTPPYTLTFPTTNVTVNGTGGFGVETSNGIKGVKFTFANGIATARWTLGTRPLTRAFINLYCKKLDGSGVKKNAAFGQTVKTGQTLTSLSVPFTFIGYNCKAVLTAFYSNGATRNYKRFFNTTA